MEFMFGKERIFNDEFLKVGVRNVIRWDVVDIKEKQELNFEFVSTNSKYTQGIRLAIDVGEGFIEVNGVKSREIQLWEDTCPKKAQIRCMSSEGKLSVYNIFNMGPERGGVKSQVDSSGMIVECEGNKRIYKCNDAGFETNFEKLVFKIELI